MDSRRTVCVRRGAIALLVVGVGMPAVAQTTTDWPVPRHAVFQLDPAASKLALSLFTGGVEAHLKGTVKLFLGDPRVPVPLMNPQPGWVGLSVDGADLITVSDATDPTDRLPLHLIQDPNVFSTGLWNTITYQISFQLYLTRPDGAPPVPQPVYLSGFLAMYTDAANTPVLSVAGTNGDIPDAQMKLIIRAYEVPSPPPMEIWFSTENGFTSSLLDPTGTTLTRVSDGDLLSQRGYIARSNHQLVSRLGIMPPVPDLGLDAAMLGPRGVVWFSFEETTPRIWSETLGTWLKHGDLLAETGQVVRTNEQLLKAFLPAPVTTTANLKWDAGLDAVTQPVAGNTFAARSFLFSTEVRFFSRRLNAWVGNGDLLSDRGYIVMRNRDLMRHFHPIQTTGSLVAVDYGLDAVVVRSNGEVWFSTEIGFQDATLGPISDGDLLSTTGRVVMRNLDLVSAFGPVEDVDNFGLDAAMLLVPTSTVGSVDMPDGDVVGPTVKPPPTLADPAEEFVPSGE